MAHQNNELQGKSIQHLTDATRLLNQMKSIINSKTQETLKTQQNVLNELDHLGKAFDQTEQSQKEVIKGQEEVADLVQQMKDQNLTWYGKTYQWVKKNSLLVLSWTLGLLITLFCCNTSKNPL